MSVLTDARLKPEAACDDADQRCALHCPTRLRDRIRRAWIKDAGSEDMRGASPRGHPWLFYVVPGMPSVRRSCLCSGAVNPRGRAGLRSEGRLAGTMAINDGTVSVKRGTKTGIWGRKDAVVRVCVLCRKGVIEGESCREKRTGCAMRTKKVEAGKLSRVKTCLL